MNDLMELVWVVKVFGPVVLVLIYFLWRDWKREQRDVEREEHDRQREESMNARISELEREQRDIVIPLVEKCSRVIAENTAAWKRLEKRLDL